MHALRDLLQPERLTSVVDICDTDEGGAPYQRMLDEGLCTATLVKPGATHEGPADLLKVTGSSPPPDMRAASETVAIHTSVSFFPDYTFGAIDANLRAQGFIAHCFADCYLTSIRTDVGVPNLDPHQLALADLFYMLDFTKPMTVEQWKHTALIAHHVCGSHDLAMHAVTVLAKKEVVATDAPQQYLRILETQ